MSRRYFDVTALVQAASKQGFIVHLHHDAHGCPIYSIGNSNAGAREFTTYDDALKFANGRSEAAARGQNHA